MNNTIYFLRHEKTKVDADTPISQWLLSDDGKEKAERLAKTDTFDDIEIIYSSTEQKAVDTAKPIAEKNGLEINQVEELCELDRDKGGFVSHEIYEELVEQAVTSLNDSVNNWESAASALKRFETAVAQIDKQHDNKKILIVGHGFTINLYFAKLLGLLETVYERLNGNDFGDWGIVQNGNVVEDIVSK